MTRLSELLAAFNKIILALRYASSIVSERTLSRFEGGPVERTYTRIAVLFPAWGLIHNELCRLAEDNGAEAVIFRVPANDAGSQTTDPEDFVGNPDVMVEAIQTMGGLDTLRAIASETRVINPDAICWACTSGSFLGTADTLNYQVDALREAAGVPATTTSVAILEALRRRNIERVCVLTPYVAAVGEPFIQYLERHGLQVLAHAHAGGATDEDIGALTEADFEPLVASVWNADAQAIVIPCTAVRVGGIVERLGETYAVPVILANPATIEHAVELARRADNSM